MAELAEKLFSVLIDDKDTERLRLFYHIQGLGDTDAINQANLAELGSILSRSSKVRDKTKCAPMLQYMLEQVGVDADLSKHDLKPYYEQLGYPSVLVKICRTLGDQGELFKRLRSLFSCKDYLNIPPDNIKTCAQLLLELHKRELITKTKVGLLVDKLKHNHTVLCRYIEHYSETGEFSENPTKGVGKLAKPTEETTHGVSHWAYNHWNLSAASKTGHGVLVAVVDSGINDKHVAFKWKIKAKRNFAGADPDDCMDNHPQFHGTAVAGVVAGKHLLVSDLPDEWKNELKTMEKIPLGVAVDAGLVICRVTTDGVYNHVAVSQALKWIYEHNMTVAGEQLVHRCPIPHDNEEENMIRIVNMSVRLEDDNPEVKRYLGLLKKQGVICVAGVGNDGANDEPGYPALYSLEKYSLPEYGASVITVGSCDMNGDFAGHSTHFAGFEDCINVLALGKGLILPTKSTNDFERFSGTSFATPAVSGLIAILLQCARESKNKEDAAIVTNRDRLLTQIFNVYMGAERSKNKLLSTRNVGAFFEAYNKGAHQERSLIKAMERLLITKS